MAFNESKALRRVVLVATALVILFGALQVAPAVLARHGLTEVEAIVASHAMMLSRGESLYWNLDQYPFTVSPYGPTLYSLEAIGVLLGAAPMAVGRLAAFAALLWVIYLVYRITLLYTEDKRYAWTGALIAGGTANLVSWGVVGQSDMPALAFSVAALERYSVWRRDRRTAPLVWCGLFIALSIFTKQSFLAAGATISVLMSLDERRTALKFLAVLAPAGVATALLLNVLTGGYYFDNAIMANLNPFAWDVLGTQMNYLLNACGALIVMAFSGWRWAGSKEARPLFAYGAAALTIFLLTSPKVGSDLNYQIEPVVALSMCAGWSLWRLEFFDKLLSRDKGLVPLLQLPLVLHLVLNCAIDFRQAGVRYIREVERRAQFAELKPWLEPSSGRILSVETDPLLHARNGEIEVEPLIYSLLVEAGVTDSGPVARDLAEAQFASVLLYHDLEKTDPREIPPGFPRLPIAQMELVREHYQLVRHVPGPLAGGLYVYEPKGSGTGVQPIVSQSNPL